jgi:WD40-like Beta Propeller Repeat
MISKMKQIICILLLLILVSQGCKENESSFPKLNGPYFGQKTPGIKAKLFAYDLISTGYIDGYIRFSPDGKEMLYGLSTNRGILLVEPKGVFGQHFAMYSKLENGQWTEPVEFLYNVDFRFGYSSFNSEGDKIIFNSYGPGGSKENNPQSKIWYIDRLQNGWSNPKEIVFDGDYDGPGTVYPTIASNGNIYFAQFYDGKNGFLYVSKFVDGKYLLPELLDSTINDVGGNHPFIAPDESYIIYDSERPNDTYGTSDLYICYKNLYGHWTKPINLGKNINSQHDERRAFVTFDQKYLFFASDRVNPERPKHALSITEIQKLTSVPTNGHQHIYWADAKIIKDLKPDNLK